MLLSPSLRWAVILNLAEAWGDLDKVVLAMAAALLVIASALVAATYAEVRREEHAGHNVA